MIAGDLEKFVTLPGDPTVYELLNKADTNLRRGNLCRSGMFLREAARRYLWSLCKRHQCLPANTSRHKLLGLLGALRRAGKCDDEMQAWFVDIDTLGTTTNFCKSDDVETLDCHIALVRWLMRKEGVSHAAL